MKCMTIFVMSCFIYFSLLIPGIAGEKSLVNVAVKNKHNHHINSDRTKVGNKNMSRYSMGYYRKMVEKGSHTFSAKKGSETKSRQSNVSPPSTKKVTIRFSRH